MKSHLQSNTILHFLILFLLLFALLTGNVIPTQASNPSDPIVTIAGTGVDGYLGDGGPATAAELRQPNDLDIDGAGNIYIADFDNHRVRKIDTNGIITTIAGNLGAGYNGDGIAATAATLYAPYDVAVDSAGNVFISETLNQRIRKVDTNGIISTVAGTGTIGDDGDGGPATAARLRYPYGIDVDSQGNLYVADHLNQRIRRIDTHGIITTVAGTGNGGYSGDGGAATAAQLSTPADVVVDDMGNLYIADSGNHRIRKVDIGGIITTVVGTGNAGFSGDGGPATSAQLNGPHGVFVDAYNNLYIGDRLNQRVRWVNANGLITTVAGTGVVGEGGDGGPANQAQLRHPFGLAVDAIGRLYIADRLNHRIRRVGLSTCTSLFDPTPTKVGFNNDHAQRVVLADMDNDGDRDVLVGKRSWRNQLYHNKGNGIFTAAATFDGGSDDTWDLVTGDVDNDGDLDIVIGNYGQQNRIYFNDGTGNFPAVANFGAPHSTTNSVDLGDIDGDGDLDIAEGNLGQQDAIYLNHGNGTFVTPAFFGPTTSNTRNARFGDIENDGDLDLVVSTLGPNQIYLNDGSGNLSADSSFGAPAEDSRGLALGDLDGDGDLDIVVGNDGVNGTGQNWIALNDGSGGFLSAIPFGTGSDRTAGIALGDVDGDGDLDIAVGSTGSSDTNSVYLNSGGNYFTISCGFGLGAGTQSIALGDLDNDGDSDVAVAKYAIQTHIYFNSVVGAANVSRGSIDLGKENVELYLPVVQR